MTAQPAPDSGKVQLVLQAEEAAPPPGGDSYACEGFIGLPVVNPCLILLHSCGSAEALQDLQALRQGLADTLRSAGARPAGAPWTASGPPPVNGGPDSWPGWQKLLVLVSDGKTPFPNPLPQWISDWANHGAPCHVLPLVPTLPQTATPQGAIKAIKAEHLLPGPLGAINAQFWSGSIEHAVPTVLALAELTSDDWRIFISYRRLDSQPLADQLFEALSQKNFDVFLDRFSINPGVDFQFRLTEELSHKSMVLLLESATVHQSQWTEHEINFAKKHRLGLLALHLPGGKKVPDIDDTERVDLSEKPEEKFDGFKGPQNLGTLLPAVLDEVVRRVRRDHGLSLLRRRQFIRDAMRDALLTEGVVDQVIGPDGLMKVVVTPGSAAGAAARAYALWMTTRPPVMADFHYTHVRRGAAGSGAPNPAPAPSLAPGMGAGDVAAAAGSGTGVAVALSEAAQAPGQTAVVVGPSAFLSTDVRNGLNWLAGISRIQHFDESSILDVARAIARGLL